MKTIVALLTSILAIGASNAQACETCNFDIDIFHQSVSQVMGPVGTGQNRAYMWTCEGTLTGSLANAIVDPSIPAIAARVPAGWHELEEGTIKVYPRVRSPHTLQWAFVRDRIQPSCDAYLGEPTLVTNRDEMVLNFQR